MKKQINQIIKSPFFSGSLVMIIGSNITNVLSYLYHLVMGRLLGPANYSELAVLISLIGILSIIPAAFGPVIVKFVSASKSESEIRGLINWFNKKIFIVGFILTVVIILCASFVASFLRITNVNLIIFSAFIFSFTIPSILNRGTLQGLLRFKEMVLGVLAENGSKLLIGGVLVYLGFSVSGAVTALIIAAFIGWFLSRLFINDFFKKGVSQIPDAKAILIYTFPVLIQSLSITSLYSTDVILVKHFFSPHDAGIYAALSTLGKIIFFAAGPITAVMFPIVSKKQAQGENFKKIFMYSFILTLLLSLGILFIYWILPQFTVNILYGPLYAESFSLLFWFGIFITLFTLSSLLTHFFLSLGKVKVTIFPFIAAIIQVLGILIYHDNLKEVITVSIFTTALLLASLLIYFVYAAKVNFSNCSGLQAGKNNR